MVGDALPGNDLLLHDAHIIAYAQAAMPILPAWLCRQAGRCAGPTMGLRGKPKFLSSRSARGRPSASLRLALDGERVVQFLEPDFGIIPHRGGRGEQEQGAFQPRGLARAPHKLLADARTLIGFIHGQV